MLNILTVFSFLCAFLFLVVGSAVEIPSLVLPHERVARELFRSNTGTYVRTENITARTYQPGYHAVAADYLDGLFQTIFATHAGRRILYQRNGQPRTPEELVYEYGLTPGYVQSILGRGPIEGRYSPGSITLRDGSVHENKLKIYIFAFIEGDIPYHAYTYTDNVTFFFMRHSEFNSLLMIRLLTHELAMTADEKFQFTRYLQSPQVQATLTQQQLRSLEIGLLALALSTLRAYVFEEQVVRELERLRRVVFPRSSFEQAVAQIDSQPEEYCQEILKKYINQLQGFEQSVKDRAISAASSIGRFNVNSPDTTGSRRRRGRQQVDFCKFLLEPVVGERNGISFGPRPRMGDGW